jgi:NADH-quinone oxidoreductase subunit N
MTMDVHPFAAEMILGAGLVYAVFASLMTASAAHVTRVGVVSCLAALVAAMAAPASGMVGDGLLHSDAIARAVRPVVLAGGLLCLLAGGTSPERQVALIGLIAGALILAGAGNLVTLALGVEATSIAAWLLAGWRRRDAAAAQAALTYALIGALASGVLFFGLSHAYGLSGGLSLADLGQVAPGPALAGTLALIGAGLAYKLAAPPFHAYALEVYQGAPAASAAVISTLPKVAALAVGIRLLVALGLAAPLAGPVVLVVATAAILVGGGLALAQQDPRRILACSAIVHVGTILLALAAQPGLPALPTVACYAAIYTVLGIGAFLCLGAGGGGPGAWARAPVVAASLAVLLAGLAGIPPLPGFFAKWLVLGDLLNAGGAVATVGAAALVLGTLLTVVAYLRILRVAWVEDAPATAAAAAEVPAWLALVCAGLSLAAIALLAWPLA